MRSERKQGLRSSIADVKQGTLALLDDEISRREEQTILGITNISPEPKPVEKKHKTRIPWIDNL